MSTELLVVCSDLHAGSTKALFPPEYSTIDMEKVIGQNGLQEWLWECWEDAWGRVMDYVGYDPWSFLFVGDAIEGLHHRRDHLCLTEVSDQVEVARCLLEPYILGASSKFFTLGTQTHTENTPEVNLARVLGGEPHPDTGEPCPNRWNLSLNGFPFVARHHTSVTSREYLRGSALSIELGNEQQAAVRRGYPPPRGLITAHRHMADYYTDGNNFSIVSGPWQMTTRFGHKTFSPMIPEPSLIVLDTRGIPGGGMPRVEIFKYTPAPPTEVKI
jgi:hypothetical protein